MTSARAPTPLRVLVRTMRLARLTLSERRRALRTTSWHMMPWCHGHLSPCGPCSKAHPCRHSTSKLWRSAFSTRTRQVTALKVIFCLTMLRPRPQGQHFMACGHLWMSQPALCPPRRRRPPATLAPRPPPRHAPLGALPRFAGLPSTTRRVAARARLARSLPTCPYPQPSPPPPRRCGGDPTICVLPLWLHARCSRSEPHARPRETAWPPRAVAPTIMLLVGMPPTTPIPLLPHRPSPPPIAG